MIKLSNLHKKVIQVVQSKFCDHNYRYDKQIFKDLNDPKHKLFKLMDRYVCDKCSSETHVVPLRIG